MNPEPSVRQFLRCWLRGHADATPGKACPRCGAWIPVDPKETLRRSAAGLAQIHAQERARLIRNIAPCPAGGYHANGEGPCFGTLAAAALYRDRLDEAGVRWLPYDRRTATPYPGRPQPVQDDRAPTQPALTAPQWLVLRGRVPRADPAH